MKRWISASVIVLAMLADVSGASAIDGKWVERVQILYNSTQQSVERVRLRVWDPEPGRNLEFLWEPDQKAVQKQIEADGTVTGRGKLVWMVRGGAAHDKSAIYSTYRGEMRDGRPHGNGRLERRDGQVLEGEWQAGKLNGEGMHLDNAGNRYTGSFVNGVPNGEGRYAAADGSVFVGSFVDGQRHGEGQTRLPGGAEYASRWENGVEVGTDLAARRADALVGGLLRAQAEGGDAGKVDLSIIVEPRMTQRADLRYMQTNDDDYIRVFPEDDAIIGYLTGEETITPERHYGYLAHIDFDDAPVYLQTGFETRDRSRVKLERLELQVEDSMVYRKPFLSTVTHLFCTGYRPGFSFSNVGWGGVEDATLSLEFYNEESPEQSSRRFSVPIGDFGQAVDVTVEPLLQELGVDTHTLSTTRFNCPTQEDARQCRAEVLNSVNMGEVAPLLAGELDFRLGVRGQISYRWNDGRGEVKDQVEDFEASVRLAYMESDRMVAEGSGGWGAAPEALRFQEIRLPSDQQNYSIDLPVRGNNNLAAYSARLKVYADATSIHTFRVAATFEDGSERYSKPMRLYYVRPNIHYYEPPDPEGVNCYLDPAQFEAP